MVEILINDKLTAPAELLAEAPETTASFTVDTKKMSTVNDAVVSGASASSSAGAVNLSLIKISTITQTLLGVAVTGLVVLATVVTIVLISTRAGFEPPLAFPDSATTYKNNVFDIYPLANDKNPRGDNLTITYITTPDYGSASIIDGNKVQFTAGKYWAGTVYMNYTCMNDKLTAMSTITVFVQNRLPEPIAQTYTISKNSVNNQLNIFAYQNNIGQKISDIDGDLMYLVNATQPEQGSLTFDNNYIYYTPKYNYISTDSFEYCVSDFNDTACSFVNVTVMNDAPVAVTDQYQIPKNTPTDFNVMRNDYDPNNDTITISEVTPAAYGGVTVTSNSLKIHYTPIFSADIYTDSFSYGITDGLLFGFAYVTVDVGNTPPVAGDIVITIRKNTNETYIDLPMSDINALDVLSITIPKPPTVGAFKLMNTPSVGKVSLDGDEYTKVVNSYKLAYTPLFGVNGVYTEVVTYNVFDGTDTTAGTVTIHVINDPPVAVTDVITASKNLKVTYNVVANDVDPNGDVIQLTGVGTTVATTQGGFYKVIDTNNIEYHPAQGFLGNDSATYTITDIQAKAADQLTAVGQLQFIVVNDPPTPKADVYTISKGLNAKLNVLANDTDPNNDAVSLSATGTPNSGAVVAATAQGEISYNALNQTYTENWYYTAADVDGATTQALVTVNVVNDKPVANDDSINIHWNITTLIDVLANDFDVNPGDKEALTVVNLSGVKSAKGGSISIISNKLVQYIPVAGYTGPDSFTYKCFDQMDSSANTATVSINVQNRAPIANPAAVTVHWSNSLPVNVLGISGNGDLDNDPVVVSAVSQPAHGTVTLVGGIATYKSTGFYKGSDSFGYTLSDWGLTQSNTVSIDVQNVAPVAAPISLTVPWNAGPTTAYVVSACSDADNDPMTIQSVTTTLPFKGSLVAADANTNIVFTPSKNYKGVQTATYVITDGPDTASGSISITVTNNNLPTASPISKTVHWSTQTTGTTLSILSVGQTDADGDALTVSAVSTPSNGVATFTNTTVTYKQNAGYTGADSFTYTITDGLDSATATINFTIYNTVPVASTQAYSVFWGTYSAGTTFAVLTGSSDADVQDTVTLKSVGTPSQGTATKSGNQVLYKPAQGNLNTATFTYTATDGLADVVKTVTVTITDQKPVAVADAVTVHWNTTSIDINVKTNDYDNDGDAISLSAITAQPSSGSIAIKSASVGTVTYTLPTGSFALGTYTGKYTVTDGAMVSDPANIAVNIVNANQPTASPINTRVHWRTPNSGFNIAITGLTTVDGDGDILRLTVSGSAYATAITATPSYVRYSRNLFKGFDTISYQVSDGKSSASSAISLESYNNAPTANNISNIYVPYTAFAAGLTINVFTLGSVADADPEDTNFLTVSAVSQPATAGNIASVVSASAGTVRFKPNNGWTGTDSFTYTVSDGLQSVTRTIGVYATYVAAGDAERNYDVHWKNYQSGSNFAVLEGYGNTGSAKITQLNSTTGGNTYIIQPSVNTVNNTLFFQNKRTFLDTDVIKVKANDGVSSGTISIYMNVYDNAPTASNQVASGKWNQAIQTNVMSGASDPDSADVATLATFTSGSKGVVTKIDANNLSYLASAGYVGDDTYTYTVTDGLLNTTRVVAVTTTNSPPVPVAQAYSAHWRTFQKGINKAVTAGAYDADGNTISLVSVTQPDDAAAGSTTALLGSNTVNINGTATPYFGKSFKFTYTVTDGAQNGQVSQQVTVTVNNQQPVAVADTDSIHWRTTSFKKNVLANDYDSDIEDQQFLKVSAATADSGGSVSFNNTHITYTPASGFTGVETITYTITDGAQTASTTLTMTVTDAAPVTQPISVSVHTSKYLTGVVIPVTTNPTVGLRPTDSDSADGPFLAVSAIVQPTSPATATFNASSVTFKSGAQTIGVSTVSYTVTDGLMTSQNSISVSVYNNAPVNNDYAGTCQWRTCVNSGVSVTVTGSAADADPEDAGKLTYTATTASTYGVVTSPSNGVFLYKLKSGQGTVTSDSFKFTTTDGVNTVQNQVNIAITNTAPVARDDTYVIHWLAAQPFVITATTNDSDANSDPFTLQSLSTATTATNGAAVSIVTPAKLNINYNLPTASITANKLNVEDKFTYKITDTFDNSNDATVSVTIYDNAPTAGSVTDATKWNVPKTYSLGALCSDIDGVKDTVSFAALTSQPAAGSAVVLTQSTGSVRFTPSTAAQAGTYSTPYSFTYTCTDNLLTGTGTVTVTVSNGAPTLGPQSYTGQHNYNSPAITITGLLTGTDPDGDSMTVKSLSTTDPSVTISNNGPSLNTATITTTAGFSGVKTLSWSVTDGQLTSNTATFTVNLLNTAPTCTSYSRTTTKNNAATVTNMNTGISDANNDPMTLAVGAVSAGSASISGNTLTYTPAQRRSGIQTAAYTVTDFVGAVTTCTVSVTITNQAPVAPAKTYTLEGSHSDNAVYNLDYLTDAVVSDPDIGDVVSLISVSGGATQPCDNSTVGSLAIVDGKIQWTRYSYTWVGSCKINVVVRDNDIDNPKTTNAVVTVTIDPTSPYPPTANNDEYTCDQATPTLQVPVSGPATLNGITYAGIMDNDVAPLGTTIAFVELICTTSGYCRQKPTVSGNIISYPVDNDNCVQDKFQYKIKTTDFLQMTAIGTVTIKFTNCFCSAKLDIFFVIDSSGSIGGTNFETQRNFLINLTNSLDISSTKVKVGVAQFGYDGIIYRSLSGSKTDVVNTLTTMPYLSQHTNTLSGIYSAMADITGTFPNNGTTRTSASGRANVPKVILIITDGVSNAPCSCSNNGARYDSDGNQMTCQGMYGGSQTNYQNQCLSLKRYPTKTCSSCTGESSGCFPCADPVKITEQINSWNTSTGGTSPPAAYQTAGFWNWKVVAIGVGALVDNSFGKNQIAQMNYDHDPNKVILASWANLQKAVNSVVDAACNTQQ